MLRKKCQLCGFDCVQVASMRAGRPVPSCDASDEAEGVELQTRQMIEWAMTGFLPNGPQSLDPPEGDQLQHIHPKPADTHHSMETYFFMGFRN